MHVISRKKLKEFWDKDEIAKLPLSDWYKKLSKFKGSNLPQLKESFPSVDVVGKCIVFDVGGNKYRVITKVFFENQVVLVRFVLTHKQYDANKWYGDCGKK